MEKSGTHHQAQIIGRTMGVYCRLGQLLQNLLKKESGPCGKKSVLRHVQWRTKEYRLRFSEYYDEPSSILGRFAPFCSGGPLPAHLSSVS